MLLVGETADITKKRSPSRTVPGVPVRYRSSRTVPELHPGAAAHPGAAIGLQGEFGGQDDAPKSSNLFFDKEQAPKRKQGCLRPLGEHFKA